MDLVNDKAQLFLLDTSCEPNELQGFPKCCGAGKTISSHVLSINKELQDKPINC